MGGVITLVRVWRLLLASPWVGVPGTTVGNVQHRHGNINGAIVSTEPSVPVSSKIIPVLSKSISAKEKCQQLSINNL
eukprot:scaffold599_cov180-Amphora_coffeaeformis.AAC.2